MHPIRFPKCVCELSILSWAQEIGNNASVLASPGIWDAWNYYLILLAASKETKQKCTFWLGFTFSRRLKNVLATYQNQPSFFSPCKKSLFFRARMTATDNVGRCHPRASQHLLHTYSLFWLSTLAHSGDYCVNFSSMFSFLISSR
jgi:hypothetical protein